MDSQLYRQISKYSYIDRGMDIWMHDRWILNRIDCQINRWMDRNIYKYEDQYRDGEIDTNMSRLLYYIQTDLNIYNHIFDN